MGLVRGGWRFMQQTSKGASMEKKPMQQIEHTNMFVWNRGRKATDGAHRVKAANAANRDACARCKCFLQIAA